MSAALIVVALVTVTGCATMNGQAALGRGLYDEAATQFARALERDPDRVDAMVGLGIARYKLGSYADAAAILDRAVTQAPKSDVARLYLALSHVRQGKDAEAQEDLVTVGALAPGTRLATQVDHALRVLHERERLTDTMRTFIAMSLESHVEMERQLFEAQAAVRDAELRASAHASPGPYFVRTPGGRVVPIFP